MPFSAKSFEVSIDLCVQSILDIQIMQQAFNCRLFADFNQLPHFGKLFAGLL